MDKAKQVIVLDATDIDTAFETLVKRVTEKHGAICKLVADFTQTYSYEELAERVNKLECEFTKAMIRAYLPKVESANGANRKKKTKAEQVEAYTKTILSNCDKKGLKPEALVRSLAEELGMKIG